ncbi:MAG: hypothetical protein VR71_02230 [Roseovarius sp. BRH_c41]|uniref:hypothetical protein n=1 Tax=Roseovarius sp. BRH_c41 TaxID=1629709 RepID=UPI0005F155F3|nr:hypothetical protein [Roseovarius sp. BRH_c41]KJS45248.1 MAG: hypothetical protein VR71_02230 [Roseovarius sp. BRH_c41]
MTDPSGIDKLVVMLASVATWLSGEVGRVLLAGASGGLVRWLVQEKRRLRDGVIAVVAGAPSAFYLGPAVPGLMEFAGMRVADSPNMTQTFGFLAGLGGMSLAKALIGLIEARVTSGSEEQR